MTDTAIVLQNRQLAPSNWEMIQAVSTAIYESRAFKVNSPEEAQVKMIVAYELGLPLTAALKNVFVVNKTPSIDTQTGMGLIYRSGLLSEMHETELKDKAGKFYGWEVTMVRVNGIKVTRRFTMDDAKQAGLLGKDNWAGYPSQMCNYRALAFAARVLFPDVLGGMNFIEEFDQGPVIEQGWADPKPVVVEALTAAETVVTLPDLLTKYGADAILAANDGKIPSSDDELAALVQKLKGVENYD